MLKQLGSSPFVVVVVFLIIGSDDEKTDINKWVFNVMIATCEYPCDTTNALGEFDRELVV